MAFQFRRGTDAQRLTITPAEGEPLYATDTHALYVGDGTTMGGIQISGGGGSTSTLVNGDYTAQLDTSGHFNANMFLALEGGPGTNPPDGHYAGYSFQGDGGYDTGMFSNGDGELQWYGNGQEVFSTTPNYFQLHKYIDMNGQDITSLNQITFGDSTVQTTAYALTTTSDVTFNSADISTSITFGPTDLGYPFFNRAKLEVASGYGGGGNVSITVPSVWSTITNALVITNGSENSPQFHLFDGITLSNSGPSDLILGSGNEYITASKDGNIYFGTANTEGKLNYHHQWKLSNTGTMTFPDGSIQTTAYLGFTQTQAFTNIFLNEAVNISGDTGITLPNENTKVIDSFRFSEYRTAKYIVQIGSYYDNSIMIAELMITFDGTLAQNAAGDPGNIYISEYGIIAPSGILGTFNAELRDGTNYIDVTFVAFQYPTPTGWHITTSKTYLNNH